jgi:hypothetical protein
VENEPGCGGAIGRRDSAVLLPVEAVARVVSCFVYSRVVSWVASSIGQSRQAVRRGRVVAASQGEKGHRDQAARAESRFNETNIA